MMFQPHRSMLVDLTKEEEDDDRKLPASSRRSVARVVSVYDDGGGTSATAESRESEDRSFSSDRCPSIPLPPPGTVPPVASLPTAKVRCTASSFQETSDLALAKQLQEKEGQKVNIPMDLTKCNESLDKSLAQKLQEEEMEEARHAQEEHESLMWSSQCGQAWKLVEGVLDIHEKLQGHGAVKPIAVDDMVAVAERFLKTMEEFAQTDTSLVIDIGYHYTSEANMSTIRTDGLLSRQERERVGISSGFHGSAYGDGIYTASNPTAYAGTTYGNVGLLVARICGKTCLHRSQPGFDAVRVLPNSPSEFAVLKQCGQCMPLFRFSDSVVGGFGNDLNGGWLLDLYAAEVQSFMGKFQQTVLQFLQMRIPIGAVPAIDPWEPNELSELLELDLFKTDPEPGVCDKLPSLQAMNTQSEQFTPVDISFPNKRQRTNSKPRVFVEEVKYQAAISEVDIICQRLRTCCDFSTLSQECSICLDSLMMRGENGHIYSVPNCGHLFHHDCIQASLAEKRQCPMCRIHIPKPLGTVTMPSGTMTISRDDAVLKEGTIKLTFHFPKTTQKDYHPAPGSPLGEATFRYWLLNDSEAMLLSVRLKVAFLAGFLFETCALKDSTYVGVTVTPNFLHATKEGRCNEMLDHLCVPRVPCLNGLCLHECVCIK